MAGAPDARWRARPLEAGLLRAFVRLSPPIAALGTAALLAPLLPAARSTTERVAWWLVLCVLSTGPLLLVDRAVRRLLPLTSLLRLSMLFPDHAPSRFKVAREASRVRNLVRFAEDARKQGVDAQPFEAAETILTLITALTQHDARTRGHSERVHLLVDMIARELRLPQHERDRLRWAALVHDIGKIELPGALLNKPGPPNDVELEALRRHPIEGARLCIPLREWLGEWALAIEQHHERWDGTGYPLRLSGTEISRAARIVAVADAYETMTAARPYRKALGAAVARAELARHAGTQFDPSIVRTFLNISLGRVRWTIGAASWLAQWPLVGQIPRVSEVLALSSVTVAGATTLALGGLVQPGQPSFANWLSQPPSTVVVEAAEGSWPVETLSAGGADAASVEDSAPQSEPMAGALGQDDAHGWDYVGEKEALAHAARERKSAARKASVDGGGNGGAASTPHFPTSSEESPGGPGALDVAVALPGAPPELHPGQVPEGVPGDVPVEMPGNKPEEKPGNPDPGSGQPVEMPGNKPTTNPGNKPEETPAGPPAESPSGGPPAENPGNKPAVPPGQVKEKEPDQEADDDG